MPSELFFSTCSNAVIFKAASYSRERMKHPAMLLQNHAHCPGFDHVIFKVFSRLQFLLTYYSCKPRCPSSLSVSSVTLKHCIKTADISTICFSHLITRSFCCSRCQDLLEILTVSSSAAVLNTSGYERIVIFDQSSLSRHDTKYGRSYHVTLIGSDVFSVKR